MNQFNKYILGYKSTYPTPIALPNMHLLQFNFDLVGGNAILKMGTLEKDAYASFGNVTLPDILITNIQDFKEYGFLGKNCIHVTKCIRCHYESIETQLQKTEYIFTYQGTCLFNEEGVYNVTEK